jgi:hypothetical protein
MSRGTVAVKAVLRKDFLQLWPIVVLCVLILFVRNVSFPFLGPSAVSIRTLIEIANGLACCTLLVAVIQQDALTGVRHDWFTRPISRGSLFVAKAIFIVVAITVPADLSLIAGSLLSDHPLSEALIEGAQFSLNWIAPLMMLAAVAALSNTLLQAAAMTLAAMTAAAILLPVSGSIGAANNGVYRPDVGWIAESFYLLLLMAASVAVLWLQYAERSFRRAAVVAVLATVIAACGPAYIRWGQVFAVQKLFSSTGQEHRIQTTLDPGCFKKIALDGLHIWGPDQLRRVGPNPIGFSTTLRTQAPVDWLVDVGAVKLDYIDNRGRTLATLWGVASYPPLGKSESHYWLLPRAAYDGLRARGAHARLTYSLSGLEPARTADIEADGSRHYINEMGFCGADVGRQELGGRGWAITADCLKFGPRPAILYARVKSDPGSDGFSTKADFRPSFLELLSVQRTSLPMWSKQPQGTPTVTLGTFRARAHFDRTFTVPGILGDEQCGP